MIEQTVLGAVIIALTRIVKSTNKINEPYLPVVAIIIGVGFNILAGGFTFPVVFEGIVTALTAMGLYDLSKAPVVAFYETIRK